MRPLILSDGAIPYQAAEPPPSLSAVVLQKHRRSTSLVHPNLLGLRSAFPVVAVDSLARWKSVLWKAKLHHLHSFLFFSFFFPSGSELLPENYGDNRSSAPLSARDRILKRAFGLTHYSGSRSTPVKCGRISFVLVVLIAAL